jgi:hypothetical protein
MAKTKTTVTKQEVAPVKQEDKKQTKKAEVKVEPVPVQEVQQDDDSDESDASDDEAEPKQAEPQIQKKKGRQSIQVQDFDKSDEALGEIKSQIEQMATSMIKVKLIVKQYETLIKREAKQSKVKKQRDPNKPVVQSGFTKKTDVPDVIRAFINNDDNFDESVHIPDDEQVARTKITSIIYKYINDKNLGVEGNKKVTKADAELAKLFSVDIGYDIKFEEFQTLLSQVYNRYTASKVTNDSA